MLNDESGEVDGLGILLMDVTPLSLGIKNDDGRMVRMIELNTNIPVKEEEDRFSTASDNRTTVKILVYQGEREMAKDNRCLGTFTLQGIPPAPRGVPKLKVIFEVDANGILNVTARDQDTGKERSISITGSSTLSKEEVDRMLKDAEENAAAERLKQGQVDLHNQVDRLLCQAEKQLANWGDKLPAASHQ